MRSIRGVTDPLRDPRDVRRWLAEHVYHPAVDAAVVGRVGLEAEFFPFWVTRDARPAARLALVEIIGIVDGLAGAVRADDDRDGRPSWQLGGAVITEEPGAQLEIAGPPEIDADTAITRLEDVTARVRAAFDAAGAGLAAAGIDCWSRSDDVPVQLEIPRYGAMAEYFARRGGPQGHLLMCASCSLQVNLDLGPAEVAPRRWLAANLLAPVLTAAFATSPGDGAVNDRALGWRGLDPTRTGVAPPLISGGDDPLEHALADALRADVLLVQRDGITVAGTPGWTFGDWVTGGSAQFGPPTAADLTTHLSTLFPEARLRGYIEVRSIDQLPSKWRPAAVALVVGALYDEQATEAALALLAPHRGQLPDLLDRAARAGLADGVLGELAPAVLDIALQGAQRLRIDHATVAEEFLARFTRRRRHPSDELREALSAGGAPGLAWAS
jgi:glutamate--cysteine ligase